ncbi:Ig-like domain-containing protein [Photorhabdus antumapuensis]|uniref:Ig-like domain-containing protein n=1 Tax=Photorhabdus antumapuensis TaxID=2862867 RepID=UPI001CEC0EAA|nr:Ig-like domain-containing protein [Photorhabdus antumapuensis]MCA6221118.1 Ig-like domain-containing protein [Photorhabdus antumapuensis]
MDNEQVLENSKTLNWVSSEKTETADKSIHIDIKVIQDNYLLHETNVIFTLDNESMAFKDNNDRKIIKSTGVMGKISVEIISTGSTPCQGNVYACLEDDAQIKASPLQIEFTAIPVATLNLDLEKDDAWANSTDENRVVATAYDKSGNGIKSQKITFNVNDWATVFPSSGITDKEGKITASIQSSGAGAVRLMAQTEDIAEVAIMRFTENPYRLEITKFPDVLSSFSSGIIAGYLYKNGIGEPNVTIKVSMGSYLFLDDKDKNMTTDKNGYFSFGVYSTYSQGYSPRHIPAVSRSSSVGISCIVGRIYSQRWIVLTPGLY